ncbi:serine/arginine repetitive matrix protein 2 [Streptomyces sp. BA2]|uniref:serine/arginine repetitive matrix protein 2 n=1 Tax=Streptomyces sp. BA2 TaxID=436595 RepID=UPI001320DC65|nr:serine/arginine repetitive matrix protein 2 [Streptomyces sp. BA2]MWA11759.1 serine/arginine repetitive matrix protein 2 [Streptomyces sp. BA2]
MYPYGPPPGPPPRIDARQLRPRRRWFVLAAVIAAVCVGVGIVSFVLTLTSTVDSVDDGKAFTSGQSVSVRIGPDDDAAIYVRSPFVARAHCKIVSGPSDSQPRVTTPESTFTVTKGSGEWERAFVLKTDTDADYRVTCDDPRGALTFAPGDDADLASFVGGIVVTVVVPLLGLLAGSGIAIIVGVRRGRHRRWLEAQAYYGRR